VRKVLGATWDGLLEIGDVKLSGLALAGVVGVVANLVLPKEIDEVEVARAEA
jgi:xanthine/uracil permease